jgi:hypothetical protein
VRDPLPSIDDALRLLANAAPLLALDRPVTYADGSTLAIRLYIDCSGSQPRWVKYSFDTSRRDRRGAHPLGRRGA